MHSDSQNWRHNSSALSSLPSSDASCVSVLLHKYSLALHLHRSVQARHISFTNTCYTQMQYLGTVSVNHSLALLLVRWKQLFKHMPSLAYATSGICHHWLWKIYCLVDTDFFTTRLDSSQWICADAQFS